MGRQSNVLLCTTVVAAAIALALASKVSEETMPVASNCPYTQMCMYINQIKMSMLEYQQFYSNKLESAWQYMIDNYDEFTITSLFTFVVHEVIYFTWSLPWFIIDCIPYFHKYKIQPTKVNSGDKVWHCFKSLMFNHCFVQLPMMFLFHLVVHRLGFSIALPLPSWQTIAWQVCVFYVIEDFYFYCIHRLLHHRLLYKHIHKVHHEYTHPFSITAEYAHPVETVFLGLGTILGPLFFARHLLTLWVWLLFRLGETVEDHSGYDLPFNPTNLIPFWGGSVHHDHHHKVFDGNYASVFTFWDWVFGTDLKFQDNQKQLASTHKL
eukprot:Ihof_evm3s668 gene=Ihof_evmTU3s668